MFLSLALVTKINCSFFQHSLTAKQTQFCSVSVQQKCAICNVEHNWVLLPKWHIFVVYWRYGLTWFQPKRAGIAPIIQCCMGISFLFYCMQWPNNSKYHTAVSAVLEIWILPFTTFCKISLYIVNNIIVITLTASVQRKKETKMFFCIVFYKTWAILIKIFLNKCAAKWYKYFPPHVNIVSTLPCETWNTHQTCTMVPLGWPLL